MEPSDQWTDNSLDSGQLASNEQWRNHDMNVGRGFSAVWIINIKGTSPCTHCYCATESDCCIYCLLISVCGNYRGTGTTDNNGPRMTEQILDHYSIDTGFRSAKCTKFAALIYIRLFELRE